MTKQNKDTFNDRMVKRTVLPAIYLWLLAAGAVVGMGIWKPDVVLTNLDGFIALIAIISGVSAPALGTVLRMWESEQTIQMEKSSMEHQQAMLKAAQEHAHIVEKHSQGLDLILPIQEE